MLANASRPATPTGLAGRQMPNGEMPTLIVGLIACTSRYNRSMNLFTFARRQSSRLSVLPLRA
jgi:hypothetical protein